MTAPKLPLDSHWTIDCGIAQSPNHCPTSCWAWRAETRSRCWTSDVQSLTCDCSAVDLRLSLGAEGVELLGAGLRVGADGGDLVAGRGDSKVELVDALPGFLDRGELLGDLVAEGAHPADQRRVGLLDSAQVLGAGLEVVEAVGLEQDGGRVGHVAPVDVDEAVGEGVQGSAKLVAGGGELVASDRHLLGQLRLALLALREHGGELRLALGGVDRPLLGHGELRRRRVDLPAERLRLILGS